MQAHDDLSQFGLAVALNACDGHNLALVDVKGDVVKDSRSGLTKRREVFNRQTKSRGLRRILFDLHHHRAANHQRRKFSFGVLRIGRTNDLSTANDRDVVRNCADLTEFVRNKDD